MFVYPLLHVSPFFWGDMGDIFSGAKVEMGRMRRGGPAEVKSKEK